MKSSFNTSLPSFAHAHAGSPSSSLGAPPPHHHPTDARAHLVKLACLSRLALLTYAVLADALIPDHDAEVSRSCRYQIDRARRPPPTNHLTTCHSPHTQGALKLPGAAGLPFFLRPFTRWDAAHFMSIAQAGRYPSLPSHAFFPLYPALVRAVACLLSLSSAPSLAALVAAALLVTNASFLVATMALHELTSQVLVGSREQGTRMTRSAAQEAGRVAYLSALLYICSPASIFYATAYSEVGGWWWLLVSLLPACLR